MKKLLAKLSLLFIIYLVVTASLTTMVYDFDIFGKNSWLLNESNLVELQKINYENCKDVNTCFLGTSKTFRSINPTLFDSITNVTKSINLGVNNLLPFRSFNFDKIVSEINNELDYVIYEIREFPTIGDNYNYIPYVNNINLPRYLFSLQYITKCENRNINWKLMNYYNVTRLFLYKYFSISAFRYWNEKNDYYFKHSVIPSNGYLPYEKEYQDFIENNDNGGIVELRKHYKKNYLSYKLDSLYNTTYLAKVKVPDSGSMLARVTLNEIVKCFPKSQIIFVIPPRTDALYYPNLYSQKVYFQSKGYKVFDFADPNEYPQLYTYDTSFEQAHLNSKGSDIYTWLLANMYGKLIITKDFN